MIKEDNTVDVNGINKIDPEEAKKLVNLDGYESDLEDIQGGIEYRKLQTGIEISDEAWNKYPGQDMVEGKEDENVNQQAEYPLLLLNYRTRKVQEEVDKILDANQVKQSELYDKIDGKYIQLVNVYKSWEDGTVNFMSKGVLDHERWILLEQMGLRPTLFVEKGKSFRVSSGILFDYTNYNPIILKNDFIEVEDEYDEINNPDYGDEFEWEEVPDSVLEETYGQGLNLKPEPNTYVPKELTKLSWESDKSAKDIDTFEKEQMEYTKDLVDEIIETKADESTEIDESEELLPMKDNEIEQLINQLITSDDLDDVLEINEEEYQEDLKNFNEESNLFTDAIMNADRIVETETTDDEEDEDIKFEDLIPDFGFNWETK